MCVAVLLQSASPVFARLTAERLRVEYLENPLGLDAPQPRLSWIVTSKERDQRQSAYQILVASREDSLKPGKADLWDSGRVTSDETLHIRYSGRELASRQACVWRVRSWDQDGQASEWSGVGRWEMGLLRPKDWKASWIGRTEGTEYQPAPMLRKRFEVNGKVLRARAYVCGLGYCDMTVNGHPVSDSVLDPGYTRYDKRVLYVTHDITPWLRPGPNAVGVMLGTGWFNCHTRAVWNFHEAPWRMAPRLLLQLHIEYADGRMETVLSDATWRTSTGPVVFDSIYGGETYDARLEKTGWDTAGDNDVGWALAKVVAAPKGVLRAQAMPSIRSERTLPPARITEPTPGVYVVDFGQNLAGFAELNVSGPPGTPVRMRYGERLSPDGKLDTRDIEQHIKSQGKDQSFQTDTYILKGVGVERWHARFAYHGFQYVEVTGLRPGPDTIRAHFIHSAVPSAGSFECSNPDLNRIQMATRWAYLSNLQGIPTDCPHREKNGWTGDAHLAAEQANFNFLPVTVQAKWVDDLGDEQRPTGELPGIVPTGGWGYAWGNGPAWDSAYLLIPHYAHLYFGDTEMFRRHYEGMRRYVDYLSSHAKHGIIESGLNDWAPWKTQTGAAITSTAYYYVDARIVAEAARILGNTADAARYEDLAENVRRAFQARFQHPDTGLYDNGSQTALSCALYQGMVDPADKDRATANLLAALDRTGNHIDTGILGAKYLLNALLDTDHADRAYAVVSQTDQPGWIWWLRQGATTLWEQWGGAESHNHVMFGDVSAWFYKALAGIRPDPAGPGFKRFVLHPEIVGDLRFAKAEYDSIRGRIVSGWERHEGRLRLGITVPANTIAVVHLPARPSSVILEGGRRLEASKGIRLLSQEGDRAVLSVGSGTYEFTSEVP